jgi:glycerol-3-phosphate acyltransferase PlsY
VVAAYGLGCLATGYLLVRATRGEDVRDEGSGRVGATNVGRVLGPQGFVITLLGDMAKAALAVGVGLWLGEGPRGGWLALLAVVGGHIWPAPLKFRGGRGIAPALGGLLALDVPLLLAVVAAGLLILLALRRFTGSGLLAVALAPGAALLLDRSLPVVGVVATLAALLWLAHRDHLGTAFTPKGRAGASAP